MTPADLDALWSSYRRLRTVDQRNRLVEHYLYLADRVAEGMARALRKITLDEVRSHARLGLIDAVERFDPARSRFPTYAPPRIRGTVFDELRRADWVPRLTRSRAAKVEDLRMRLGRAPTADDAAELLGVDRVKAGWIVDEPPPVRVYHMHGYRHTNREDSFGPAWRGDWFGHLFGEVAVSRDFADPLAPLQHEDALRAAFRKITRQERTALIRHFLDDMTMKAVAASMGLSESRVSQIISGALAWMREELAHRELELVG